MGLSHSPRIVTDGLVLCLDAANKRSYPGAGTTWTDLTANKNNGTLTNMTNNFSTDGAGSLTFDGTNERVTCGNDTSIQITEGTISAWFAANNGNSGYNGIIAKQQAWALFVYDDRLVAYSWGTSSRRDTGIDVGNGAWNNAVMTFTETTGSPSNNAKIYLNGDLVLTTTVKHVNNTVTLMIGEANSNQYFSGKIAQASVYNRVLSADQVRQNYLATKGRYA